MENHGPLQSRKFGGDDYKLIEDVFQAFMLQSHAYHSTLEKLYMELVEKTRQTYYGLHREVIIIAIIMLLFEKTHSPIDLDTYIKTLNLNRTTFFKDLTHVRTALYSSSAFKKFASLARRRNDQLSLIDLQTKFIMKIAGTSKAIDVGFVRNHVSRLNDSLIKATGVENLIASRQFNHFIEDKFAAATVIFACEQAKATCTQKDMCSVCELSTTTYGNIRNVITLLLNNREAQRQAAAALSNKAAM